MACDRTGGASVPVDMARSHQLLGLLVAQDVPPCLAPIAHNCLSWPFQLESPIAGGKKPMKLRRFCCRLSRSCLSWLHSSKRSSGPESFVEAAPLIGPKRGFPGTLCRTEHGRSAVRLSPRTREQRRQGHTDVTLVQTRVNLRSAALRIAETCTPVFEVADFKGTILAILLLASSAFGQRTYTTMFPANETPISENHNWVNQGSCSNNILCPGSGYSNVNTNAGIAHG